MEYFQILELVALITGLISLKAVRPVYLKLIVLLLAITVLNELIIVPYIGAQRRFSKNVAYNIFSFIDMAIWFIVFYKIHKNFSKKYLIVIAALACFIYSLIELSVLKSWQVFRTDSFRIYNIVIVSLSILYFYSTLKKEYHDVLYDQLFWMCSAAFLFHSIFFLNITTIAENNYWRLKNASSVFYILHNIANSCYYLLLCTMFIICFYRQRVSPPKFSQDSLS